MNELPRIWLVSDARNDERLDDAIARLPPRSGVIYRHYHLPDGERRARFETVRQLSRTHGHTIILSGSSRRAQSWGADGIYGAANVLDAAGSGILRLATAHDADEIEAANEAAVEAVLVSPVFATRTHKNARTLGVNGFARLAKRSLSPVLALGGMTTENYATLPANLAYGWAAIDGLSSA